MHLNFQRAEASYETTKCELDKLKDGLGDKEQALNRALLTFSQACV